MVVGKTDLVQQPIHCILHNADHTFLPRPALRDGNAAFTEVSQTGLRDGWQQVRPVPFGTGLIERGAEEPCGHRVRGGEGNAVSANVKIGDIVFGEVDGEAATGSLTFEIVVKSNSGWVVEQEMGGRLGDEVKDKSQQAESERRTQSFDEGHLRRGQ